MDRTVPFTGERNEAQRSQTGSLKTTELINTDTDLNCRSDSQSFLSLRQKCIRDLAEFKVG